jgi:hypothetical protein
VSKGMDKGNRVDNAENTLAEAEADYARRLNLVLQTLALTQSTGPGAPAVRARLAAIAETSLPALMDNLEVAAGWYADANELLARALRDPKATEDGER